MRTDRPIQDLVDIELECARVRGQLSHINVVLKEIVEGDGRLLREVAHGLRSNLVRADARLDAIYRYAKENK
jgi:hypothetical protein